MNNYYTAYNKVGDGCCGTITGRCKNGVFMTLEDGQTAFARFGGLPLGTKVYCTYLKPATEKLFALVSIDSVRFDDIAA
ncbi:MAG: hypothetical protein IJ325_08070 [Clostridia bacterium]|nr:hypothetical protein [Clostridia bacterium]